MRSIKPAAFDNAGIFRTVARWGRALRLRCRRGGCGWRNGCGWRGSHRRRSRRLLNAVLNGCLSSSRNGLLRSSGICRVLVGLAVGNEFRVARSARTRRGIGGQSAGPMRPKVSNIAATACQTQSKTEQDRRRDKPLVDHVCCRILRLARSLHRTPSNVFFNRAAFH
jgi:hypothetical protein